MNLKTRLRSTAMRYFASPGYAEKLRNKARRQRGNEPATVHYFHQVDDPYSHLAVQKLDQLRTTYDLAFQPHLVCKPDPTYRGSADHFDQWAWRDARSVAADYGTNFDPSNETPGADLIIQANQALSGILHHETFAETAIEVGQALWSGQQISSTSDRQAAEKALDQGNALRQKLGHYQGAMFYFEGEWFWGIDRLRLLEERLTEEGFRKADGPLCVPEPTPIDTSHMDCGNVLLEYFPSLRSPYTAIGHQRVLDLMARSGVGVKVRPVTPMLMRGIPAPPEKQRYIITDSGREARAHSVPFGRIVDPFGEPVRRAFALFPGAAALGQELEYVTAYLRAAWFDGVDITNKAGLQRVADKAGIEWQALLEATQNTDWQAILDDNLNTMLEAHLWGVPSFRVSGGNDKTPYACWGQDRIWRVENEIARRL